MTEKRGRGRPRKTGFGEAVNGDVEAILRKVRTVKIKRKLYAVCADLFRALDYRDANGAVRRFCRGAVKHRIRTGKNLRMTSVIPVEDMRCLAAEFVADDWGDRDDEDGATSIVPVEYTKEEKK